MIAFFKDLKHSQNRGGTRSDQPLSVMTIFQVFGIHIHGVALKYSEMKQFDMNYWKLTRLQFLCPPANVMCHIQQNYGMCFLFVTFCPAGSKFERLGLLLILPFCYYSFSICGKCKRSLKKPLAFLSVTVGLLLFHRLTIGWTGDMRDWEPLCWGRFSMRRAGLDHHQRSQSGETDLSCFWTLQVSTWQESCVVRDKNTSCHIGAEC